MMFPSGPNPNVTTATLRFDGMNYNRLPRVVAANSGMVPSELYSWSPVTNTMCGRLAATPDDKFSTAIHSHTQHKSSDLSFIVWKSPCEFARV